MLTHSLLSFIFIAILIHQAGANMTFGGRNWLIQRNILKSGNNYYCMVNSNQN